MTPSPTQHQVLYGLAAPTLSNYYFQEADLVINAAPTLGGVYAWECVAAGYPGTWIPLSFVAATNPGTQTVAIAAGVLTFTTGYAAYETTLNANVTSLVVPNGSYDAQQITLIFLHDATTNPYTVAAPANIRGFFQPGTNANGYNAQPLMWNAAASLWIAQGYGVVNA